MAKTETVIETVTMQDGRVVEFAGKRRMLKESFQHEDGSISIRVDLRNGQTRHFPIPPEMLLKFAAHGAEQKFGDEVAGLEDLDDATEAIDNLIEVLNGGNWSAPRAAGSGIGGSILFQALVKAYPTKTKEALRAFLSLKTQAEKMAMRNSKALAPIITELEAAKAAKRPAVSEEDMFDGL